MVACVYSLLFLCTPSAAVALCAMLTFTDFLESRACGIHREHEEFGAFDSGGELKVRPSNLRHSDSGSCCNLLVPKLHDLQADAVE